MRTHDENVRLARILGGLAKQFRLDLTRESLEVYISSLGDLGMDEVVLAIQKCLSESEFFPTVASIRHAAGCETLQSRAEKAWMLVDASFSAYGDYRHLCFEDGTINAVIRSMGGLCAVIEREGEDYTKWARKEFIEGYLRLDGRVDGGSEFAGAVRGMRYADTTLFVESSYSVPALSSTRGRQSLISDQREQVSDRTDDGPQRLFLAQEHQNR